MRPSRLIGPELLALANENPHEVAKLVDEIHPEDVAEVILDLDDERAVKLFTALPAEFGAEELPRLDPERQARLSELLGSPSVARIATEMAADDRVDFFSVLPSSQAETVESIYVLDTRGHLLGTLTLRQLLLSSPEERVRDVMSWARSWACWRCCCSTHKKTAAQEL